MLIFCYSFLADYLPIRWPAFNQRRFYVVSLVIATGMCFLADADAYRHLRTRRRMVLSGIEQYRADPGVNSPMIDPIVAIVYPDEKRYEREALTGAIQENVYVLPKGR